MKVGLIFECGPDGADKQVCEHLAERVDNQIELNSITLDNKPGLIEYCGRAALELLNDGCQRVVISWDLYPPWREKNEPPCFHKDRHAILHSLAEAGVTSPDVYLVCITQELEAWLLSDGRAISYVLSKAHRKVKVGDEKAPDSVTNPKTRMTKLFQQRGGMIYLDRIHAVQIVRALPDLKRIRRSPSLARFVLKTTGVNL